MGLIYLTIAFVLNSAANIILKVGAKDGIKWVGLGPSQVFTHNLLLITGLFLFAVNVVFYFLALRNLPLSTAYPIMMVMSFLIINSYALLFLGEKIGVGQLIGYLLVIVGILMIFFLSSKN